MLRSATALKGYSILASDGELGKVDEFYFDDASWTIRYLVVDTGGWVIGRRVLISPVALGHPNWEERIFPVALTKRQVEKSPDVETHRPVSRQNEIEMSKYFGWPSYWGDAFGAPGITPAPLPPLPQTDEMIPNQPPGDPHLQNTKEVLGYQIEAKDGAIGHLADFIVDDETWIIRYLVVDTGKWLSGKQVLVAPQWVENVTWAESKIYVGVSQKALRGCPPFDPEAPVNREYEIALYDYYGRPRYWSDR